MLFEITFKGDLLVVENELKAGVFLGLEGEVLEREVGEEGKLVERDVGFIPSKL